MFFCKPPYHPYATYRVMRTFVPTLRTIPGGRLPERRRLEAISCHHCSLKARSDDNYRESKRRFGKVAWCERVHCWLRLKSRVNGVSSLY